jgi:prepilin-type N-terminal cleavage/methylation domain-containing protein
MRRRSGFTLVEVLVSMALIIFIMTILSEAFAKGTEVFRQLKALGDLQERMRTAANLIRRDLACDHFDGGRKLSDSNFWLNGPPQQGFLRIWQGSPLQTAAVTANMGYVQEGTDPSGIPTNRAVDHALQMAVKYRGNQRDNFLFAAVPTTSPLVTQATWTTGALTGFGSDSRFQDSANGVYSYEWADVSYFLLPSEAPGTTTQDTTDGTVKRWALYRRQQVAVPDNTLVPAIAAAANLTNYLETSAYADPSNATNLYFNGPADLTMPARRFARTRGTLSGENGPRLTAAGALPAANTYSSLAAQGAALSVQGSDLVLTDVISFEVQVLLFGQLKFVPVGDASVQAYNTLGNTFFPTTGPSYLFDTWSQFKDNVYDYSQWNLTTATNKRSIIPLYQNAAGQTIRVVAVKVILRAWDERTNQTRQVTIVQAL